MTTPNQSPYATPLRVHATNLRADIDGVEYQWMGGNGAIIKSREYGIKVGDMRMIGDIPFFASCVRVGHWWARAEVCWTIPNNHLSIEWIRVFKGALFSE